jgi:hypothetical protein
MPKKKPSFSPRPRRITTGPGVTPVNDRMHVIITAIAPTAAEDAITEYSALLCAAVMVMVSSAGIPYNATLLSRVLGAVVGKLTPVVDEIIREESKS